MQNQAQYDKAVKLLEEFEAEVRGLVSKYAQERMQEIFDHWFDECCKLGAFVNTRVVYTSGHSPD